MALHNQPKPPQHLLLHLPHRQVVLLNPSVELLAALRVAMTVATMKKATPTKVMMTLRPRHMGRTRLLGPTVLRATTSAKNVSPFYAKVCVFSL